MAKSANTVSPFRRARVSIAAATALVFGGTAATVVTTQPVGASNDYTSTTVEHETSTTASPETTAPETTLAPSTTAAPETTLAPSTTAAPETGSPEGLQMEVRSNKEDFLVFWMWAQAKGVLKCVVAGWFDEDTEMVDE